MKKIKYFLFCLLILFCSIIKINTVLAETIDCSSSDYQCKKCVYTNNSDGYGDYTVYLQSTGDGTGNIAVDNSIANGSSGYVSVKSTSINFANFVNSSKTGISCLSNIYFYKTTSASGSITIELASTAKSGYTSLNLNGSESTSNAKSFLKSDTDTSKVKSCSYANGDYSAVVTRDANGKLTVKGPEGFLNGILTDVSSSDYDGTSCPEGIHLCCNTNRVKTCNITKTNCSGTTLDEETDNSDTLNETTDDSTESTSSSTSSGECPIFGDPNNSEDFAYYLQSAFNIIKFAGIVAAIVMTIKDLLMAIASQKSDSLKTVALTAIKRLIYAVLIFFLPNIINLLFGLIGLYGACVS